MTDDTCLLLVEKARSQCDDPGQSSRAGEVRRGRKDSGSSAHGVPCEEAHSVRAQLLEKRRALIMRVLLQQRRCQERKIQRHGLQTIGRAWRIVA
jgi:hypothetical protein